MTIAVGDVIYGFGTLRIVQMKPYGHGWVAFTEDGRRYDQRNFRSGLNVMRPPTRGYFHTAWPAHLKANEYISVETQPMYVCNFCGKSGKSKGPILSHAFNCSKRP